MKSKRILEADSKNVKEIVVQSEKRQQILKELRQVLQNGIPQNI